MNADLGGHVARLIEDRKTMVLATAGAGAWAAPVYYIFHADCFYFFSSPRSRHILEALATGQCAAAIFKDASDWRAIEGLQMEGRVEEVAASPELFEAYVARFPTARELGGDSAGEFAEKLRAKIYRFVPSRRFYLNNGLGFGRRVEL